MDRPTQPAPAPVVDYDIITAVTPKALALAVKPFLNQGWEPYGAARLEMAPSGVTIWFQTIVKYG